MAKVGIFETPPRKWFPYDTDTEVELEFISKERMSKLIKQADDAAKKIKGTASIIYDMFLGKAAVYGWRNINQDKFPGDPGLKLPGGTALPFNENNRNLLMKSCSEFSTFVFRTCTDSANFLDAVPDSGLEDLTLDELVNTTDLESDETKND